MKENLKRISSVHEAGHAMAYHLFGYNIDYIEATNNGEGYTRCLSYKPTSHHISKTDIKHLDKRMEAYAIICLSGYCAELKYTNRRIRGIITIAPNISSDDNDIDSLQNEMEKANLLVGGRKYDDMFLYLSQTLTRRLIAKKNVWNGIITLSNELVKSGIGFIGGRKAHQILSMFVKHGVKNVGFLQIPFDDIEKQIKKLAYLENAHHLHGA